MLVICWSDTAWWSFTTCAFVFSKQLTLCFGLKEDLQNFVFASRGLIACCRCSAMLNHAVLWMTRHITARRHASISRFFSRNIALTAGVKYFDSVDDILISRSNIKSVKQIPHNSVNLVKICVQVRTVHYFNLYTWPGHSRNSAYKKPTKLQKRYDTIDKQLEQTFGETHTLNPELLPKNDNLLRLHTVSAENFIAAYSNILHAVLLLVLSNDVDCFRSSSTCERGNAEIHHVMS